MLHSFYVGTVSIISSESLSLGYIPTSAELSTGGLPYFGASVRQLMVMVGAIPKTISKQSYYFIDTFSNPKFSSCAKCISTTH